VSKVALASQARSPGGEGRNAATTVSFVMSPPHIWCRKGPFADERQVAPCVSGAGGDSFRERVRLLVTCLVIIALGFVVAPLAVFLRVVQLTLSESRGLERERRPCDAI
jgi:hypothetical protein